MAVKILFLCTHNACRSQLAEAIARQRHGDRWQVASAGSEPAGRVHPLTGPHLARHGYDCRGLASKGLDGVRDFAPDAVITVCDQAAGEACPLWLGAAARGHWGLPDPSRMTGSAAEVARAFDTVIALLEQRLDALAARHPATLDRGGLAAALDQIANTPGADH